MDELTTCFYNDGNDPVTLKIFDDVWEVDKIAETVSFSRLEGKGYSEQAVGLTVDRVGEFLHGNVREGRV